MPTRDPWTLYPETTKRQREYDSQRATQQTRFREAKFGGASNRTEAMPSSKGEPTDPELRDEKRKEVKNMEKGASSLLDPLS